LKFAVFSTAGI